MPDTLLVLDIKSFLMSAQNLIKWFDYGMLLGWCCWTNDLLQLTEHFLGDISVYFFSNTWRGLEVIDRAL